MTTLERSNRVAVASAVTPDTALADYFREVAASQPAAPALTTAQATYSYADIDRWSDAVASDILAAAPSLDPPIAIVTRDNIALVSAVLGAAKAGAFFVMVDAADPDERIALILQESGARFCLVDSDAEIPEPVQQLPYFPLRSFQGSAGVEPPARQAPHRFSHVVFTSGTTGMPKGVVTPHRHLVEKTLRNIAQHDRTRADRCTYTALPGFTRATNVIFGVLLAGATLCAFDARNESLASLAAYITRERITLLSLTPSLFRRLIAVAPKGLDFSSVRRFRLGADKISMADVEMFRAHFPRDCTLDRGFASTETGGVFEMCITHDTPLPGPLVPMGRPRPGVEVWLLDADGNEVPEGEAGQLVVRSNDVADGYWNQPELTAQKFVIEADRPGVFKFFTGDLVKRDAEGIYYYVGRNDSRLKIQGRRTDPSEVEAHLLGTGDIHDAAVVGKTDAMGDLRLVAYVVMKAGRPFDPRSLRSKLRATAPSWMVPSRIFQLDAIPSTRAMKVDRASLIARVDDELKEATGATDAMQALLVDAWSRVIGCPVHVDDDFFDDLGGESVIAAHLVTEVQRLTGKTMALSLLLELNTVSKMAGYLSASDADSSRLAVVVQQGTTLPPLFCVCGKGGSVIVFRKLATALGAAQPFYGLTHHGFVTSSFPSSSTTIAACYADAIRKIHPGGPYYVAGYSGGGQIAFEIACQMERAGEQVAFLGLIDSAGAAQKAPLRRRLANRLDMLRQRPGYRAAGFAKEALTRSKKRIREMLATVPDASSPLHESNVARARVKRDFTKHLYAGPVTLFRARNGLGLLGTQPDLGWRSRGVVHLNIVDVIGDHVTMLTDEVESLGSALASALANARALQAEKQRS